MKRSAALTGLSHDHHQALHVALKLKRATDADIDAVRAALADYVTRIGEDHFDVEEELLVGPLRQTDEGAAFAGRMISEHARLRQLTAEAPYAPVETLHVLGAELEAHVRFEERQTFPFLEDRLSGEQLEELGRELAAHGHG